MKTRIAAIAFTALLATAGWAAEEAPYDLLFKNGTLDTLSETDALAYTRAVTSTLKPEAADRDTGRIVLDVERGEKALAHLEFRQGEKHRNLGSFPASVGNPMIMYFYESTVRDMAEMAGGSPFYIRNRVKDALVQPVEITEGEATWNGETVATKTVVLEPFANDPNRAQMQGFGDLALRVVMSDAVPGWYLSLTAEAPAQNGGSEPVYRSELNFDGVEEAR